MTAIRTPTLPPGVLVAREMQAALLSECAAYHLSVKSGLFIALCAPAIMVLYFLLMALPGSREFAVLIVQENHPVEIATFLLFFVSSLLALHNAYYLWHVKNLAIAALASVLMFVFLFVIAMEEIAWGQQFFSFSTPDLIQPYNMQHEVTIHNLKGIHGNAAKLYILLCLAAMTSMFWRVHGDYRAVMEAMQAPKILLIGLVVVLLASLPKLYTEHFHVHDYYKSHIRWTTEAIELTLGVLALSYVILKRRSLHARADSRRASCDSRPRAGPPARRASSWRRV